MLNFRELALASLKGPAPRLFRARDDAFLFSADASFLPDDWLWPENTPFEAIRRGNVWHLRLKDSSFAELGLPEFPCPPFDGTAETEMFRLIFLHPGRADAVNAPVLYALWKAKEAGRVEETCIRMLPLAAQLINSRHPLPACAFELLL